MFFIKAPQAQQSKYIEYLTIIGGLSKLFSDNTSPYLYYRIAEMVFCRSFEATNFSRSDTSADAGIDSLGFGLKTFLDTKGASFQKVAEFSKFSKDIRKLTATEDIVTLVAKMRNERIDFAKNLHGLDSIVYHLVTRSDFKMSLSEEKMEYIDISSITKIIEKDNTILFNDGISNYSFSRSKNTLMKKFYSNPIITFPVKIFEDPFSQLYKIGLPELQETEKTESIFLPLYSPKTKQVEEKSGLNAWNAGGRKRDLGEVYIPIPSWIHKHFPDFFPNPDISFDAKIENKKILKLKVCQSGGKALMSNPNNDLGQWLLRDVLKLKEGEKLTYRKLISIGIDSVEVVKTANKFEIYFKKVGAYDTFAIENNQ